MKSGGLGQRGLGRRGEAMIAGGAVAFAMGWNFVDVGAAANSLSSAYRVGLPSIGLLTTAVFVTHTLVQVPGGRWIDDVGARRVALIGLMFITAGNALAAAWETYPTSIGARLIIGLGTGTAFLAGSDYVRVASSGSLVAQGAYGGIGLGGSGAAIALVPVLTAWIGWSAAFLGGTALALGALWTMGVVHSVPGQSRASQHQASPGPSWADRRLGRYCVMHCASLGLGTVIGAWVVSLLVRAGGYSAHAAGLVGSLTLLPGLISRPFGGWLAVHWPSGTRETLLASIVAGVLGTLGLAAAPGPVLGALAATLVGIGAGLPFATVFTGAASTRPTTPASAIGMVSLSANVVIILGTLLVGYAFRLPGQGRVGFVAMAILWGFAALMLPAGAVSRKLQAAPGAIEEQRLS